MQEMHDYKHMCHCMKVMFSLVYSCLLDDFKACVRVHFDCYYSLVLDLIGLIDLDNK